MHKHTFFFMKEYYSYLLISSDNDCLGHFYLNAAVLTTISNVPL